MLYQRGPVQRRSAWSMPTWAAVQKWHTAMKPMIDAHGFQTWVTGRSVYDIAHARDFDVVYTGPMTSVEELSELLNESVRQGFEQNMLVDAKWAETTDIAVFTDRPVYRPVSFIFSDYYEFDNGQGHRVIADYRQNPRFTGIGARLVMGNYANNADQFKAHQIPYLRQHGHLPHQTIEQFLRGDLHV